MIAIFKLRSREHARFQPILQMFSSDIHLLRDMVFPMWNVFRTATFGEGVQSSIDTEVHGAARLMSLVTLANSAEARKQVAELGTPTTARRC
jgi:hypothetical protein